MTTPPVGPHATPQVERDPEKEDALVKALAKGDFGKDEAKVEGSALREAMSDVFEAKRTQEVMTARFLILLGEKGESQVGGQLKQVKAATEKEAMVENGGAITDKLVKEAVKAEKEIAQKTGRPEPKVAAKLEAAANKAATDTDSVVEEADPLLAVPKEQVDPKVADARAVAVGKAPAPKPAPVPAPAPVAEPKPAPAPVELAAQTTIIRG